MSTSPDPTRLSPQPPRSPRPSPLSRSPPSPRSKEPPFEPTPPPLDPPQPTEVEPEAYEDDNDDEIPYPEPTSNHTLLPPPDFAPFFTIVEDTTTGEHYHPLVHYVFADDDPAIVSAAAMRSMGLDDTKFLPRTEGPVPELNPLDDEENDDGADETPRHHEAVVESPLPPPIMGAKERYLIIDVAADGHTITSAHSMSPDWQITNTAIRSAPSFDQDAVGQGYMLRIEGIEIPGRSKGKSKGRPGEAKLLEAQERARGDVFAALDGLLKGVEGGLEVAGKIKGMGVGGGQEVGKREEGGEGGDIDAGADVVVDSRRNSRVAL